MSTAVLELEAARTRGESFYRPGLDVLRAGAFLLVFVAHGLVFELDRATTAGAIARTGEFGVCVFFFLSSYLITELLLREKRTAGTIAVPAFYARRVLRIWPLYFAMIAVGWLYGLVSPTHTVSLGWGFALTFLFSNWYSVGHGYPPGFLFPLWSIAVEEQFYLAWPWLARWLSPGGLVGVASLLLTGAYLTLAVLLRWGASLDPGVWTNSLFQFQFFALGMLTAVVVRGRTWVLPRWGRLGLLVLGLACLRAAQAGVFSADRSLPHDFLHIAPRMVMALPGCLCLFLSVFQLRGEGWQKPVRYLGKISYGLYVYHVLWLGLSRHLVEKVLGGALSSLPCQVCAMAVALPATIGTAMVSYRYLETPFLRWKRRFTVVASRPV